MQLTVESAFGVVAGTTRSLAAATRKRRLKNPAAAIRGSESPATMKTVNIPTKAKTINSLLKKSSKGRTNVSRSPKGREFILAEIDDFDREIELTRQNKALMKFLDSRGKQTKAVKAAEVKKQLGLN